MMAVIKTLILISVIILPMMMMAQDVNPVCHLPLGKEEDEIRREKERVLKIFHEIEREIEQTCSSGAVGPREMTGDPSLPVVLVSPTQTVTENQTATFYCSAIGNPEPTVTWTKVNGSLRDGSVKVGNGRRLDIIHSTFNDSGEYKCTAVNILGRDEKIVKLIVGVSPRFTKVPGPFLVIKEDAIASVTCEAFSYPPSVVTWTRPLVALPKGRSSVTNGTLTIEDFSAVDTGTYVCTVKNKLGSVRAVTTLRIQTKPYADSCKAALSNHSATNGTYDLKVNSNKFQVYCDINQGSHWTLVARFSNRDTKNWMRDDGHWWYDQNVAVGTTTDPSVNADMISPAFWLVSGREFKITRSDDSSHAPLLQTTGNCLGGQTFRSKITSYGVFRYRKVWSSYRCLGNCTVKYGGQYKTTEGFKQAECNGSLATSNKISFWCHYSKDGSVMMIGSGGKGCERADHGIGITEANHASFEAQGWVGEYDFGNDAEDWFGYPTDAYSLNLWIR